MSTKYPGPVPRLWEISKEVRAWLELIRNHINGQRGGVSGTFVDANGNTITVKNGIITNLTT